jgi:hypothetical protein
MTGTRESRDILTFSSSLTRAVDATRGCEAIMVLSSLLLRLCVLEYLSAVVSKCLSRGKDNDELTTKT